MTETNSIIEFNLNHFYGNGLNRNVIVAVVIYAILKVFKWFHIGGLFLIYRNLFSNAAIATIAYVAILFSVTCIESKVFAFMVCCLFYEYKMSSLAIIMFVLFETELLSILCVCL